MDETGTHYTSFFFFKQKLKKKKKENHNLLIDARVNINYCPFKNSHWDDKRLLEVHVHIYLHQNNIDFCLCLS